jgi:hypothetical protein
MTEEHLIQNIKAMVHSLSEHMSQLEQLTGCSLAIVLNDNETYTDFNGCSIREILSDGCTDDIISEDEIATF